MNIEDLKKLAGVDKNTEPSMGENLIARLEANAGLTFKIEKNA